MYQETSRSIPLKQIVIEDLSWQPDKTGRPVLSQISAVLKEGNFYGILGPNGAGKSSLVRILLKLIAADGGRVVFHQEEETKKIEEVSRNEMSRMLAFLPQNIQGEADFTVADVVAMGREPYRRHFAPLRKADQDKIEEALEYTSCTSLRDRSIRVLSGGERQRVMVARTIAQDTPWIVLDEPVSNLDIRHQADLMLVLDRLRREKSRTVIAILHDLNLAAAFCNQIIFLRDGKLLGAGDTEAVMNEKNLKAVYDMDFRFLESGEAKLGTIVPRIFG